MAITQKTVIQATMTGQSPSHSLTNVSVRDVKFPIDEPIERGGTNLGPSPTETAIGALIGCTSVIANKCAEKLGIDIGHLMLNCRKYLPNLTSSAPYQRCLKHLGRK